MNAMARESGRLAGIDMIELDEGFFSADSHDVPGLFVAARGEEALRIEVEQGIKTLFRLKGQEVEVNWVERDWDDDLADSYWREVLIVPARPREA